MRERILFRKASIPSWRRLTAISAIIKPMSFTEFSFINILHYLPEKREHPWITGRESLPEPRTLILYHRRWFM